MSILPWDNSENIDNTNYVANEHQNATTYGKGFKVLVKLSMNNYHQTLWTNITVCMVKQYHFGIILKPFPPADDFLKAL